MGSPTDLHALAGGDIIDTYMALRRLDGTENQRPVSRVLSEVRDTDEANSISFLFGDQVKTDDRVEGAELLLPAMDRFGISRALLSPFDPLDPVAVQAVAASGGRLLPCFDVQPLLGYDALREIDHVIDRWNVSAVSHSAAFHTPVPINDKRMYPIYAKCIERDIPIFMNVGVPGPRIAYGPQYVGLLDEVCAFFPELKIVMRHGAEPWEELAVKLMLRWPNLYYSTSAFAPKYYPRAIVDFANTRGADKVIYAGYFPIGLTLDRIFAELVNVPFRDHVWPKFLRENAQRVLGLAV